jgi:quercetin dioxygenase-like cupin family protein
MRGVLFLICLLCLAVGTAMAQDPVKVEPKHYKVEFQNDQVRVIRAHLGPHEKSAMHEHPANVLIFLTDGHIKFTFPDGKTQESHIKAGETRWSAGDKHQPENLGDKPFEVIVVELKGKAAAAAPAKAAPAKTK